MSKKLEKMKQVPINDWRELFEGMEIGIIVIEREQFLISKYNRSAERIFEKKLKVGNCLTKVSHELIDDDLDSYIRQMFEDVNPVKKLVSTKDEKWFAIRIEPFKNLNEDVKEAVLSFVNVTKVKVELEEKIEAEQELRQEILNVEKKERWRLGQFLHDSTAQNLLGIKMLFDIIEPKLQQLDEATKEELEKIKRLVVISEKSIRELSHFVLPIEGESKVSNAFEKLVKQTKDLYGVECQFNGVKVANEIKDPTTASSLYYLTQEAINNAVHHGQADVIEITLSVIDGLLNLTVKDNGIGYDEGDDAEKEDKGRGINIMRHRAKLLGGTLEISESPNGGTIVRCEIPREGPH